MIEARAAILARIATAQATGLAAVPESEKPQLERLQFERPRFERPQSEKLQSERPRAYRSHGEQLPGSSAVIKQLVDRLRDYQATVIVCRPESVPRAVQEILDDWRRQAGRRGSAPVVLTGAPPDGLRSALQGFPSVVDTPEHPLSLSTLDTALGIATGCAVGIAETGTLILDGSADQGRRAVTLVPDRHLVVVRADSVVQTVPEGLARIVPTRPLTLVSGPSATSDIELARVEGVHGPRTLAVVIVDPNS